METILKKGGYSRSYPPYEKSTSECLILILFHTDNCLNVYIPCMPTQSNGDTSTYYPKQIIFYEIEKSFYHMVICLAINAYVPTFGY